MALKDGTNEWRVSLGYDSRSFDAGEANTEALRELNDRDASVMVGTRYNLITLSGCCHDGIKRFDKIR